jgi:hypothetical protein
MAPPAKSPTPAPSAPRPAAAAARRRGGEWKAPGATVAIILEIVLISACLVRAGVLLSLQGHADSLAQAQKQSEKIRQAWSELADQGAMLQARINKSAGAIGELMDYITKAAAEAGLKPEFYGPKQVKLTQSVRISSLLVRARGPERRILKLLLLLDLAPTVAETELLELTGESKGNVAMKLALRHYEYSASILRELKEFVHQLPAVPGSYEHRASREERLFLPNLAVDESALQGWPKIMLDGFSEDKAMMLIAGESRTFAPGAKVAEGIIYSEKLSVNQVVLRRVRDSAEVILTVGGRSYALRPSEVRGMSEFVLTLQKRPSSDLISPAPAQ